MTKCWYMWSWHRDARLAQENVNQLNTLHPEDEIIVIGDGTITAPILGCTFIQVDSPKWLFNNDAFLHDRYSLLLEKSEAQHFIKVDPDTEIHKRVESLDADWYGQTFSWPLLGTAGCAMGLSRKAIQDFLSCPLEHLDYTYESVSGAILMAEDPTLAYYLTKLGYTPTVWREVRLARIYHHSFDLGDYALTHPKLSKNTRTHIFSSIRISPEVSDDQILKLLKNLDGWLGIIYCTRDITHLVGRKFKYFREKTSKHVPKYKFIEVDSLGIAKFNDFTLGDCSQVVEHWYSKECLAYRKQGSYI